MRWLLLGLATALACAPAREPLMPGHLAATLAAEVAAALPAGRPGRGITDYPGHAEGDVPKAYAMVLLAEIERHPPGAPGDALALARTAGRWLIDNADSDGDGVAGWGLPVAWDAYDDGTTNPPHTEYTISTALVLDALLSWLERDADAPRERIVALVQAAIAPYLEAHTASPSGMAPYSLAEADRRYDTFNPAAYLAGQMQRASLSLTDPTLRRRYAAAADATMRALLQHRRLVPGSGHWYWNYSVQQDLPNDLPHAGYTMAGIRAYMENGGRLAEAFDWHAVRSHLRDFRADDGTVRAFPRHVPTLALAARTYDIGFALHLACTEPEIEPLMPWLIGALEGYRGDAQRFLKYPKGAPAAPGTDAAPAELVVNEYETYLYRGLATCAASAASTTRAARRWEARVGSPGVTALRAPGPEAAALAAQRSGVRAGPGDSVPLLPAEAGSVSFDAQRRARIELDDGTVLQPALPGVPVQVLPAMATSGPASDAPRRWVFLREFPSNRLWLLQFDAGRPTCRLPLDHGPDADARADLRAAALHGGRLHIVHYHNATLTNWHVAFDLPGAGGTGCPRERHRQVLPSLEDPAGATYEMIAPLRFVGAGGAAGALSLVGGPFEMPVGPDGLEPARRLDGCLAVIESALTPRGLAHLCLPTPSARQQAGAPRIVAPADIDVPRIDPGRGVPWQLRWSLGALHVEHARTPRQLRHLLRRDIARTLPGGWMEFGINNEEGRIPWSQIYMLNGLLDLLDLARRDRGLLELYGPLLPEVRRRLDLEMQWLDAHVAAARHQTRAFTVDRSRALFGVQTARFLLVMHRYLKEVPGALPLTAYAPLKHAVPRLEGHIEMLATAGEDARWIRPGLHHLRWSRGSAFGFDGMAVPYNHQNEWAYAVLATADDTTPPGAVRAATDVLRHFTDRIAPAGLLPASGEWDYWWGRAYDGWRAADGLSVNRPQYDGDRIRAWISFRTIDAMALAAGASRLGAQEGRHARDSAMALARQGLVYPFANHAWVDAAAAIHLSPEAARAHARAGAPWEIGNAVWSLAVLARHGR